MGGGGGGVGDEPGTISRGSQSQRALEEVKVIIEGLESSMAHEEEDGGISTDWKGGLRQYGEAAVLQEQTQKGDENPVSLLFRGGRHHLSTRIPESSFVLMAL